MIERSVARRVDESAAKHPPSTRENVADVSFCEVIAEDLGIKVTTARTAFIGEPKVRCIRVIEWALRNEPDDPEKRSRMVLAWAKKRKAGAFKDPEESQQEIARAVAEYWTRHPEKLAETLKAALQNGA